MNCDVCNREIKKVHRLGGYKLCSKHMHQLFSFGEFKDNCPRTIRDLNAYRIEGDITIFDLYSSPSSIKIGEFIIDTDELVKIKYHKWRKSHDHVITGLPAQGTQRELSWVILNLDNRDEANKNIVVDHINGNAMDNRKSNLRICTQPENVINKSFMSNNTSGFIGVSYRSNRDRWDPEIRIHNARCHLGYTKTIEEAVYKRWYAEQLVFEEFANENEQERKYEFTKNLSEAIKHELRKCVEQKLQAKNLWQSAMLKQAI